MHALSDEIEFLVLGTSAIANGDGDEVLSEITCGGVDEETLAGGGFDGDGGECAGG